LIQFNARRLFFKQENNHVVTEFLTTDSRFIILNYTENH